MRTQVRKWGNSLAVRIPRPFAMEAGLTDGSVVDISARDGKIIVDPHPAPAYRLDELLRKVTRKNVHAEVGTGASVGREVW